MYLFAAGIEPGIPEWKLREVPIATQRRKTLTMKRIAQTILAIAIGSFTCPAFATEPAVSDRHLDQEALEKILPSKPPYSPYWPRFSKSSAIWRHASPYLLFNGRGGRRCPLGPEEPFGLPKVRTLIASSGQPVRLSRFRLPGRGKITLMASGSIHAFSPVTAFSWPTRNCASGITMRSGSGAEGYASGQSSGPQGVAH